MIRVLSPGLLTTVQDLGRPGLQHLGITLGGVMDGYSARIANALVGNGENAALLEITLQGPRLHFESCTWLAIAGADLSPELEGQPVPTWRPVWLPAGSCLGFGAPRLGCRAYLAVAGGLLPESVLGSCSTDLRGGFGGMEGRALRTGDCLPVGGGRLPAPPCPERWYFPAWSVSWAQVLPLHEPARLRLIPGPDWEGLSSSGRQALAMESYRVANTSDRMGLRLQGPPLRIDSGAERLSAGVTHGSLQLPQDGQPIVLGVDRQTTGGYPLLGTVASIDLPHLAQLRPGATVSFDPVGVEQAQALYSRHAAHWKRLAAHLPSLWPLNPRAFPGKQRTP